MIPILGWMTIPHEFQCLLRCLMINPHDPFNKNMLMSNPH